jgi:hypothetical protein
LYWFHVKCIFYNQLWCDFFKLLKYNLLFFLALRAAIPAGNSDSGSSQQGFDLSVSSRGTGEDPTTRKSSNSVNLGPESTKDATLTCSDLKVSDPAGIAELRAIIILNYFY